MIRIKARDSTYHEVLRGGALGRQTRGLVIVDHLHKGLFSSEKKKRTGSLALDWRLIVVECFR